MADDAERFRQLEKAMSPQDRINDLKSRIDMLEGSKKILKNQAEIEQVNKLIEGLRVQLTQAEAQK